MCENIARRWRFCFFAESGRGIGIGRFCRSWFSTRDLVGTLTYRERYENLLARTGCDALTGALDRQSLEVHGRRSVEHAAAAGRHLALLLVDIDHFKDFNDRFGHAAGDGILKRIVLDVIATVRMSDFTYRFGGEEFVVIADGLNIDDAWALAERSRRRVAAGGSESEGRLAVSVGIAHCPHGRNYEALFDVADRRLYEAKAAGRNRVVGGDKGMRLVHAG